MTREDALRKVAKLMRLSSSSNAHEAATALRMAQTMMEKFSIEVAEVDADGLDAIHEETHIGRGRNSPAYTVALANLISKAFAVRVLWVLGRSRHAVLFVGPGSRAKVACYCYEVMLRQLERDRRKHLSRVRKAANRAARGDTFGMCWVHGASAQIQKFAGADDMTRIDLYMQKVHGETSSSSVEPRTNKAVGYNDHRAGERAGRAARLDRGVQGSSQTALEHQPNDAP